MTKCIVLGEQPTEVKKKPIEFVKALNSFCELVNTNSIPAEFENIELISKPYSEISGDMMFAYNNSRSEGVLFFGKWNDGVVE